MKHFYTWTRDLHLYLGLFASPFLVVFAVSTLLLNHPTPSRQEPASRTSRVVPIEVPEGAGTVDQARQILRQLNLTGEIDYIRHDAGAQRLVIPVIKPTEKTTVTVDLRAKTATVEQSKQGLAAALIYLHRMPGPHNVNVRGNWIYTRVWGRLADVTVAGVLFLGFSGLYLWWTLKAERKTGWVLLSAGSLSLAVLVLMLCV
jgi:hypothetical protein